MDPWVTPVVTGIIAALGWAASWGTLRAASLNNAKAIGRLQKSSETQWSKLDNHGERICVIEAVCEVHHWGEARKIRDKEEN